MTDHVLRVHRRQFVLGPEPVRLGDGWLAHRLDGSIWVSFCSELRTGWATDADGARWALLGLAVETSAERDDPLAPIATTSSRAVPDLSVTWAGRWVLVGDGEVHGDAAGQLACYYGLAPDGRAWASSSPALLASILSADGGSLEPDRRVLRYEEGFWWYAPPRTRFAGMRRLLPSQTLALHEGVVRPRPLTPPIDPSRDYEDALDTFGQSLVTAMRRLSALGTTLWVGLSGGVDSRLILAAAHRAGVDVTTHTRIQARTPLGDRLLPSKLAGELGYRHVVTVGTRGAVDTRRRLVAQHTAGGVADGDAVPLLEGVRDHLDGINVTGQCFPVGKLPFRGFLPDTVTDAATGARQIARAYREPLDSNVVAGLREWLEWTFETPQAHLDWRDRFNIEQRLAGWGGAKEQIYDLARLERMAPVNSAASYALLLGMDERRRKGARHQVELIERMAPALLKYPINPPDTHFGRARALAVRARHPGEMYRRAAAKVRRAWRTAATVAAD